MGHGPLFVVHCFWWLGRSPWCADLDGDRASVAPGMIPGLDPGTGVGWVGPSPIAVDRIVHWSAPRVLDTSESFVALSCG